MKQLPWLRLYTEIIDDEKLGLLAFEDRWHFIALLCLKGKGVLDSEPDTEMLWRKAAFKMGLTVAELEKVVVRLARMKLINQQTLQPLAWDDRQSSSDSSTERTRKYREKQRIAAQNEGDDKETSQERHSDGLDIDKELEPEQINPPCNPPPVDEPSVLSPPLASTKKTGTRLPEDWQLPKAWGEWALGEKPDWSADDVRRAAARFHDHWLANANRREGRKADWSAAWRNWVRTERQQRPSRPPAHDELAEQERRRQTTEAAKRKLFGDQAVSEKEVHGETIGV